MTNYDLEVINGIIQGSLYFVIESKATASPLWVKYENRTKFICLSFRSRRPIALKTAAFLSYHYKTIILQIEMKQFQKYKINEKVSLLLAEHWHGSPP